jgi:hypothetical protein
MVRCAALICCTLTTAATAGNAVRILAVDSSILVQPNPSLCSTAHPYEFVYASVATLSFYHTSVGDWTAFLGASESRESMRALRVLTLVLAAVHAACSGSTCAHGVAFLRACPLHGTA